MFLELKNIKKNFDAVQALDGVDLKVGQGEIHGLLGENGAGKTTLMNILAGSFPPKEGEISAIVAVYDGDEFKFQDTFIIEDGSTVFELLDYHLDLVYTDSEWGANITEMAYNGVVVTLGNQEYFAFYINEEYAVTGVSSTDVIDGNTYKFVVTGW